MSKIGDMGDKSTDGTWPQWFVEWEAQHAAEIAARHPETAVEKMTAPLEEYKGPPLQIRPGFEFEKACAEKWLEELESAEDDPQDVVGPTARDEKIRKAAETAATIYAQQGWEFFATDDLDLVVPSADMLEEYFLEFFNRDCSDTFDDMATLGSGVIYDEAGTSAAIVIVLAVPDDFDV